MKQIIKMCILHNIELKVAVREYVKALPKTKASGAYKGN